MCCVTAVLCQVFISSLIFFVTHPVIKAWPNNYGNKVPALDVQWHSKLLWNMRGKIFIWRKSKLELPCHLPSLMINFSCKQRVFIALNPGICSIAYAIYMWEMCIHIGMRYLCTTHIIDAYSSTNKENASSSMHIYICIYQWQWHSKHIHLGCVDTAYGYGICKIHVAICCLHHKELLRHQYLLEDCSLYGIHIVYL